MSSYDYGIITDTSYMLDDIDFLFGTDDNITEFSRTAAGRTLNSRIQLILNKYRQQKLHIFGDWSTEDAAIRYFKVTLVATLGHYCDQLYQITEHMERLSYTPVDDKMESRKTVSGTAASMSENSPVSNDIDTITTPFLKSKGKNNHTETESVTHDTPEESLQRIDGILKYEHTLSSIAEECLRATCAEYHEAF